MVFSLKTAKVIHAEIKKLVIANNTQYDGLITKAFCLLKLDMTIRM